VLFTFSFLCDFSFFIFKVTIQLFLRLLFSLKKKTSNFKTKTFSQFRMILLVAVHFLFQFFLNLISINTSYIQFKSIHKTSLLNPFVFVYIISLSVAIYSLSLSLSISLSTLLSHLYLSTLHSRRARTGFILLSLIFKIIKM